MLILDRQTNQAIYLPDDLLLDTSVNDGIVSPRNLDNGHRFKVLYDKTHSYSKMGRNNSVHSVFKKLQLKIRFDNQAGAITSLTQNSLTLFVVSDEASNAPSITHSCRVRYVDN